MRENLVNLGKIMSMDKKEVMYPLHFLCLPVLLGELRTWFMQM